MTEATQSNALRTNLILGTAGHIDHGKSSLVLALTGTDPDRLAEEKQRGITIELGFAQLTLPDGTTLGIVDVPGHERFVRQMIAGATGIDIALLCIAADDGIMPQTIEHLAVLELLGIPRGLVALTKSDLVDDEWIDFISAEIESLLEGTSFEHAPVIPVSSKSGAGLDQLKQALLTEARKAKHTKQGSAMRLPVDRVFTIKGSGTVVTGTLWSGLVAPEDEVEVLPHGTIARVRSVQVHGSPAECAQAGNRVALNLSSVKTDDVRPGDFIATPGSISSTDRFDTSFTYFDTAKTGKPLKSGSRIHLAHGTREVIGRILFMDGKALMRPNESGFAQFRLEEPLPLSWADRFIVRSYSPVQVIGGGKVLLSHPRHRTNTTEGEAALLEALNREDAAAACRQAFALHDLPVSAEDIALLIGIDAATSTKHLDALCSSKDALKLDGRGGAPLYTTRPLLQKHLTGIENALFKFHTQKPEATGLSKAELKQAYSPRIPDAVFDALLAEAQENGRIVVSEGEISHPTAGGGAKRREEDAADLLLTILKEAADKPPTINELLEHVEASQSVAYRALGSLEKKGEVKRLGNEFYFTVEALDALEAAIRGHLEAHAEASAAELKDAMGTSRKYAIPLLEYFDAQGITERIGDNRRLRR